jgi:ElaB/YqjD/DUF883 family membrane-anchored ribosome-binding protein
MTQSSYSGLASDQISDLKDKATKQFSSTANQAESMARQVADQSRAAGERMQEVGGKFRQALDKSIKDRPIATLAAAAIVAFALGALWNR